MKNIFHFIISFFFFQSLALAASGGDHAGVPWETILGQFVNFSLLAGLLVYFFKDKVQQFFGEKHQSYLKERERADKEKLTVQVRKEDLLRKLEDLKKSTNAKLQDVTLAAQKEREETIASAQKYADGLISSAEANISLESKKAKEDLAQNILREAIRFSRKNLQSDLDINVQQKLKNDFISKIKVLER